MSTSRQQLQHGYLGPGDDNVLWKIQPSTERDDGYNYVRNEYYCHDCRPHC